MEPEPERTKSEDLDFKSRFLKIGVSDNTIEESDWNKKFGVYFTHPDEPCSCWDCGEVMVEPEFYQSKYGRQGKYKYCFSCEEHHRMMKEKQRLKDQKALDDLQKLRNECEEWFVIEHLSIICKIIKPYIYIANKFKNELDAFYENLPTDMNSQDKFSAFNKSGILPYTDIYFQYFIPGIQFPKSHEICKIFRSLPEYRGFSITELDLYNDHNDVGLEIKIGWNFYSIPNDAATIYFSDLGEHGKCVKLYIKHNY